MAPANIELPVDGFDCMFSRVVDDLANMNLSEPENDRSLANYQGVDHDQDLMCKIRESAKAGYLKSLTLFQWLRDLWVASPWCRR